MRSALRGCAAALLLASAACGKEPTRGLLLPGPPASAPVPLGVYEITVTGIGAGEARSSIRLVEPARDAAGPRNALTTVGTGLVFEQTSSSSFTEGPRGAGGQRYIAFTYRARNGTGAALKNLTMMMVSRASTIPGTPLSQLRRFDGTAANPAIAPYVVPTGAVAMRSDLVTMQALYPDVIQVYEESEVKSIARPGDVTGIFPYGYVVRAVAPDAAGRTLPAATQPNQFDGVLTLSFRVPLQATSAEDVFALTFQALAVLDGETRLTESMEEAQDTSAVRRLRERAAALGATSVSVLPGSPLAGAEAGGYPGQRDLCSVRTAGTPSSPATYINAPAAYARLALLRPGEVTSNCAANFRWGTPQRPTLNMPLDITVKAMDRYGNVVTGAVDTVRLTQASGPAASVGAPAVLAGGQATIPVTYHANGTSVLSARGSRNRGQEVVEVAVAATVVARAGDNQAAMAGSAVPAAPSVLVRDLGGNPLPGVPVTFSVTGGGGYLTGATATTNASGIATVGSWVLGSPAAVNSLQATAAGAAAPATFAASGCSGGGGTGFRITLCYITAMTPAQRAAFEGAAARWQAVVAGDVADVPYALAAGGCGTASPAFDLSVDDLLIFAGVEAIDGPGGILGSAGPCHIRAAGGLPFVGLMRFDAEDVAWMEGGTMLQGVIAHEMGHVLGIGTLWQNHTLVVNPSPVGGPAADTWYAGAGGIAGFNLIGGNTYTRGQKAPVENSGPGGTINVHWRESVLANELMTGYVSYGSMPLSQLTVRSLVDLGYAVDASRADPFFLVMSAGTGVGPDPVPLVGDVAELPLYSVDAQGRRTRIR